MEANNKLQKQKKKSRKRSRSKQKGQDCQSLEDGDAVSDGSITKEISFVLERRGNLNKSNGSIFGDYSHSGGSSNGAGSFNAG